MHTLKSLADDWPAISALLDQALAIPASGRLAWLDALPASKAGLKATLQALLATQAQVETDDFLGTLPALQAGPMPNLLDTAVAAAVAGADARAGDTVGPYRLISLLGQGGMGAVWLADRSDRQLKRQVALKLPRLAWGGALVERLRRERDILAQLTHPNIARLYDAGVDSLGRPYLALEVIEGQPIDVYCRERALPVRDRLGLLLQVAAAVAHAHARLIVHRDLKPANVLVTNTGEVRLLDFGIAKLMEGERTEETQLTRVAGRALTLDYASPEQIRGEPLGTASDQYSLGVVAFELLAGARPYRLKRGSAAELEQAIESADLPLASSVADGPTHRKQLRGDLDAILNRALKKRPEDRYASVADFAADIERHRRREPVQARPDSRRYRVGRFVTRHRWGVAVSAALVLTVSGGTAVSAWQAAQARAQASRAEAALNDQEAVNNLYIDAMTRLSASAASDAVTLSQPHAVGRTLEATLRSLMPRYAARHSERQSMLATVASQLNYASDFERSLAVGRQYLDDLKTHGGAAEKLIVAHAMLGRTLVQLGRLDEAEDIRRAGVAWPVAPGDRRAQVSQLDLIADLGGLLSRRGKREEAESVLLRGAALGEAQLPRHLARAQVLTKLGIHDLDFDPARALRHAKQAAEMQAANGTAPVDTRASTLEVLGLAQAQNGDLAAAEASFAQSHALSLSMFGPANRNVARSMGLLSGVIAHRGEHARARQMLAAEVSALAAIDSVAARIATEMLRARQLEIEWLHGDMKAAMAFLGPPPGRDPAPVVPRDGDQIAVIETRALLDAGRIAQAAARIGPVAAGSAQRGLAIGGWFGMAQTLALTQLAQGQPGAARETARALRALHAQDDGLRSWSAVVSAEIAALAAARGGDTRLAEAELAALEAGPGGPRMAAPAVERAESALRRAEIRQQAGRGEPSQDLARTAMSDLQQQHPDSPRLAQVRALLGAAR